MNLQEIEQIHATLSRLVKNIGADGQAYAKSLAEYASYIGEMQKSAPTLCTSKEAPRQIISSLDRSQDALVGTLGRILSSIDLLKNNFPQIPAQDSDPAE